MVLSGFKFNESLADFQRIPVHVVLKYVYVSQPTKSVKGLYAFQSRNEVA